MVIYTSEEGSRRIGAYRVHQYLSPAGVLVHKLRHIMNKPRNKKKRLNTRFFFDCAPIKCSKMKLKSAYIDDIGIERNSQVFQSITGSSFDLFGQDRLSWRRFKCFKDIESSPLRISFSGKIWRWLASPKYAHSAINHLVGSYWYHFTALR